MGRKPKCRAMCDFYLTTVFHIPKRRCSVYELKYRNTVENPSTEFIS